MKIIYEAEDGTQHGTEEGARARDAAIKRISELEESIAAFINSRDAIRGAAVSPRERTKVRNLIEDWESFRASEKVQLSILGDAA